MLQPGKIVLYDGREHAVIMVNESRAYVVPVNQLSFEKVEHEGKHFMIPVMRNGASISVNSEIPVIRDAKVNELVKEVKEVKEEEAKQ